MANPTIGLRLSDATYRRLKALGKARDRSPHYLMKAAIERYLELEEALEAERRLVKDRWERFELTGKALEHADVKSWASGLGPGVGSEST